MHLYLSGLQLPVLDSGIPVFHVIAAEQDADTLLLALS
jgi:hypothetical protein